MSTTKPATGAVSFEYGDAKWEISADAQWITMTAPRHHVQPVGAWSTGIRDAAFQALASAVAKAEAKKPTETGKTAEENRAHAANLASTLCNALLFYANGGHIAAAAGECSQHSINELRAQGFDPLGARQGETQFFVEDGRRAAKAIEKSMKMTKDFKL